MNTLRMMNPASTICTKSRGRQILTVGLILVAAAWGRGGAADGPIPSEAALVVAVARGFDWIAQHPATLQDGGLVDIIDEGVGSLVLYNLAPDPGSRAQFAVQLRDRVGDLEQLPEFTHWVKQPRKPLIDHYHLVLAAHLMQRAGKPGALQPEIVARAQRALVATPQSDPTQRLTIALFLSHLGEDPGISLPAALSRSRIDRIARGQPPVLPGMAAPPRLRQLANFELYALAHEIIALTDFGGMPLEPWLADRCAAVVRFLVDAVGWAGATGNVDLASELLVSIRFLKEPLSATAEENLRDFLYLLVKRQRPDGSWGTFPTQRRNKARHAVFTATTALWVYLYTPGE